MKPWIAAGLLACAACGGETFVGEGFYRRDGAPPIDATAPPDAPSSDDAPSTSSDASDASSDVRADASDANVCTPFDGGAWTCFVAGQPMPVKAPSQFCTDWGGVRSTPSACTCKETYACACLAQTGNNTCQGGLVWHCDDTGGKLATWCAQ